MSTAGLASRLATLLSALVICCAAPASADPPTVTGSYTGADCTEVLVILPLPTDRAAAMLPNGYLPESLTGLLTGSPDLPGPTAVTAEVTTCRSGSVDGIPTHTPFAISDLGLLIRPHDNTPGLHVYSLRYLLTDQRTTDILRSAGFSADRSTALGARPDGTADAADIHLRVTAPAPYSPISAVSIWHRNGPATALLRAPLINVRTGNGVGCVTTDPGSLLIPLIGPAEACGIGVILHYDTATTVTRM